MTRNSSSTHSKTHFTARLTACVVGLILMIFAAQANAQTVHQFSYNNSTWIDQNLFGSATDLHTGVASFLTTPNDQTHAFYLDSSDDIHQLFFNGTSWTDENLTAEGFGPPAMPKSQLAGFSIQNFQYVYYVAQNQHVHQLNYNNATWVDSDLTSLAGGLLSSKTPRLAALTTGGSGLHVYYLAKNGHISQLYNVSGTWGSQDLTQIAGAPSSKATWMSAVSISNFQYVYYVAKTGHVHELYYNNSTWLDEDLTSIAGTLPSAAASGVASTVIASSENILAVYFIANNNHVWQMLSGDNVVWASTDMTGNARGPLATPTAGLVAFTTTPNNDLHVYYVSKKHVNQLFLPSGTATWQNSDLTATFHGSVVNPTSAMAGFSLQNFQYLYYVAK